MTGVERMELREVLVVLGVVLIAVILWDGLRRMQSRKANKYRGGYTHDPDELKKQAELERELPNGGARVREMTEKDREDLSSRLNLRERVPMLMDSVEQESAPEAPATQASTRAEQQSLDFDAPVQEEPKRQTSLFGRSVEEPEFEETETEGVADDKDDGDNFHFAATDDYEVEDDPVEEEDPSNAYSRFDDDDDVVARETIEEEPVAATSSIKRDAPEPQAKSQPEPEPEPHYQEDTRPVEELVIIHVMAREGRELNGGDLLELLIRAGLRYGPLDIFHYRNPKGQLEFSLANCVQPGTLNPDSMEQMTTPGVTLFMQLPQHADMMESFDHMHEMALFLAKQMDAVILDEEHSTVTLQRVEHYRERLRNFARSQLIQAHE